MARWDVVLFDLDGTLTDPKEGITRSIAYALGKMGVEAGDPDGLTRFIGPPLARSFAECYGFDGARVAEAVRVPVFANGEVWTLDDYLRCREVSGVEDIMLGRGLVSRPGLARQIAAWRDGGEIREMPWSELLPLLRDFWLQARRKLAPRYAPGRLKQWLGMLTRTYPEAVELFARIRRESDCETIDRLLQVSFSQAA